MEPPGGTDGAVDTDGRRSSLRSQQAYRRPMPRWAIILILVVGFTGILAVVFVFGSTGNNSAERERPTDPAEIVDAYLTALQAEDAEEAYSYLAESASESIGGRHAALSDVVLLESNFMEPFRDGEAGTPREEHRGHFEVPATFRIGGERVERTFRVCTDCRDDAQTYILDGLITVQSREFVSSGLQVNGVQISDSTFSLFPGTYVIESPNRFHELEAPNLGDPQTPLRMVVDDDVEQFAEFTPVVTEAAIDEFRSQVLEQWRECIDSTEYSTNCGLHPLTQTVDGNEAGWFVRGSVERTVSPEVMEAVETAIAEAPLVHPPDRPTRFTIDLPFDPNADMTTTVEIEDNSGDEPTVTRVEVPEVGALKAPVVDFGRVIIKVIWL